MTQTARTPGPSSQEVEGRVTRRALLGSSAAAAACLAVQPSHGQQAERREELALIYRGRASSLGIPADTATFLRTCSPVSAWVLRTDHGDLPVNAATLARASLYVQPGGGNDFTAAWRSVKTYTGPLREFIHDGGRYLGICMGGYLAGSGPGYDLLPGNCDDHTQTRGAELDTAKTPSSASVGQHRRVARSERSSTKTARTSGSTAEPVRSPRPLYQRPDRRHGGPIRQRSGRGQRTSPGSQSLLVPTGRTAVPRRQV